MRLDSTNPWLTKPSHSALVGLPTHSLWASISGPLRTRTSPLLIFFTGAGGTSASLIVLQRQLSKSIRCLFYDRAGYDQSTLPPYNPSAGGSNQKDIYAQDTAADLAQLLEITDLQGLYILVAHSYGGIPARAFLSLQPDKIAGMCLFDTATEIMFALCPRLPPLELEAVASNVDFELLTHMRDTCGMTDAEWTSAIEAVLRSRDALKREDTHGSAYRLAGELQTEKQVLGDKPLSVVRFNMARDFQIMLDAGVELGDGTDEERRVAQEFIDKMRVYGDQTSRVQCGLSSDVTFRYYAEWGHDLPIRKPEVAVEEVRKLVDRVSRCLERAKSDRQ